MKVVFASMMEKCFAYERMYTDFQTPFKMFRFLFRTST